MKYKLVGGPCDGCEIQFAPGKIAVQRYLYLNGDLYWIKHFAVDEDGFTVLEWQSNG